MQVANTLAYYDTAIITGIKSFMVLAPVGYFEHFAILSDPVTVFTKLRSALHKQGTSLAPKQVDPLSPLNKRIHPFHLDRVSSQTQIQQP
jgi:hypothetical protein